MTFNISSLPTLQNFLPLAAAKQPVEDNPSLVRDEQQVGITRTSADVSAEQAWLAFRRYLTPLQDKLSVAMRIGWSMLKVPMKSLSTIFFG